MWSCTPYGAHLPALFRYWVFRFCVCGAPTVVIIVPLSLLGNTQPLSTPQHHHTQSTLCASPYFKNRTGSPQRCTSRGLLLRPHRATYDTYLVVGLLGRSYPRADSVRCPVRFRAGELALTRCLRSVFTEQKPQRALWLRCACPPWVEVKVV